MKSQKLKDKEEVFDYLDELRDSGVTNMFDAGAYLQQEFGYDKQIAGQYLLSWMDSFGMDSDVAELAFIIRGDDHDQS